MLHSAQILSPSLKFPFYSLLFLMENVTKSLLVKVALDPWTDVGFSKQFSACQPPHEFRFDRELSFYADVTTQRVDIVSEIYFQKLFVHLQQVSCAIFEYTKNELKIVNSLVFIPPLVYFVGSVAFIQ